MLKYSLCVLVVLCVINKAYGAPALISAIDFTKLVADQFRDVTLEKLTPKQLDIVNNTAEQHDISVDDVLVYMHLASDALSHIHQVI